MKHIIIKCVALLLLSSGAIAGTWNESNGKKVIGVQVLDHGGFVVQFDSVAQNYCTAGGTDKIYFYSGQNGVTTTGITSLLSAAFTALSTGMTVDVVHDNDAGGYCWGRYLMVKS